MGQKIHDFYEGINVTMGLYNFAIKYWHDTKPGIKTKSLYNLKISRIAIARLEINSASTTIARTNEIINDLESSIKREEYNNKINNYIDQLPSFSKIQSLVELTPDEKRQKIKNCLAHSNFKIVEHEPTREDDDYFEVLIENEFIKGVVTLEDLDGLKRFYTTVSDELDLSKDYYSGMRSFITLRRNNTECLERAIKEIGISKTEKFFDNASLQRNLTLVEFGKLQSDEHVELNEWQQELIKNYIKYIGINNWISLSFEHRTQLFCRHIKFLLSSKVDFRQNEQYVVTPASVMVSNKNILAFQQLEFFKYEAPCAYVSCILDLGYFCFNYLREVNKKEDSKKVDFHNFNLDGIEYDSYFDDSVRYVDESVYINRLLNETQNKKNKTLASINKMEQTKKGLNSSSNVTEEKRQQLIEGMNNSLKQRYISLKESELKEADLQEKLKTARKYYDSSNFFRHLRNSFAHGFYEVDYSKALKTKRLEDIIFSFKDYEIDPEHRNNRTIVFEMKITAKRLIKLLNDFGKLLSDTVEKKQNSNVVIISTSGKHSDIEDRVNKIEQDYAKKKVKVIRAKDINK